MGGTGATGFMEQWTSSLPLAHPHSILLHPSAPGHAGLPQDPFNSAQHTSNVVPLQGLSAEDDLVLALCTTATNELHQEGRRMVLWLRHWIRTQKIKRCSNTRDESHTKFLDRQEFSMTYLNKRKPPIFYTKLPKLTNTLC